MIFIRNKHHVYIRKFQNYRVAFLQRGTLISDAAFYHLHADGKEEALHVMYHGIRGTQNVAGNKDKGAASGNSIAREVLQYSNDRIGETSFARC